MPTVDRNTVTTTRQLPSDDVTTTSVQVNSTTTYHRQPDMVDYIYWSFWILVIIIGIIGFIKSVSSRKNYKCPECGESFRTENMEPKTCKVCGANLEETDDADVNDKTK